MSLQTITCTANTLYGLHTYSNTDWSWAEPHDSGTNLSVDTLPYIEVYKLAEIYYLSRIKSAIDTSAIPSNANIVGAKLYYYFDSINDDYDGHLIITEASDDTSWEIGSSLSGEITDAGTGWNEFDLSSSLSYIEKEGTTYFQWMDYAYDYSDIEHWSGFYGGMGSYAPYLEVTITVPDYKTNCW